MKRLFGLTPSQFIAKGRITAASRLLQETDQSVADIAPACGFYDHSAFTPPSKNHGHDADAVQSEVDNRESEWSMANAPSGGNDPPLAPVLRGRGAGGEGAVP